MSVCVCERATINRTMCSVKGGQKGPIGPKLTYASRHGPLGRAPEFRGPQTFFRANWPPTAPWNKLHVGRQTNRGQKGSKGRSDPKFDTVPVRGPPVLDPVFLGSRSVLSMRLSQTACWRGPIGPKPTHASRHGPRGRAPEFRGPLTFFRTNWPPTAPCNKLHVGHQTNSRPKGSKGHRTSRFGTDGRHGPPNRAPEFRGSAGFRSLSGPPTLTAALTLADTCSHRDQ